MQAFGRVVIITALPSQCLYIHLLINSIFWFFFANMFGGIFLVSPFFRLSFCTERNVPLINAGMVTGLHLLPVYPSSGDGGFAPITYKEIDPHFGTWADIDT